jgi:hypothetical protein
MSNPVVSPRGASSANDDEGELLVKAAWQPALASVAGQLAQNKQPRDGNREADGATKGIRSGKHQIKCIVYDMAEFLQSCVERYLELAKKTANTLRKVATPFIEAATEENEDEPKGELQPIAARILMKILFAARMARYDLLRPTCYLATKITKWSARCDRALHRLVCYINCSLDIKMTTWVGDKLSKWELVTYSDADLAGDQDSSRSTSGVFLCMRAPRTFVTLQGISKRQSCVSHSTPEAEIVAADFAIRTEALPALQLWEHYVTRNCPSSSWRITPPRLE